MKKKCSNCGYEWDYKGKMKLYASCPDCRKAVKLIDYEDKKQEENK